MKSQQKMKIQAEFIGQIVGYRVWSSFKVRYGKEYVSVRRVLQFTLGRQSMQRSRVKQWLCSSSAIILRICYSGLVTRVSHLVQQQEQRGTQLRVSGYCLQFGLSQEELWACKWCNLPQHHPRVARERASQTSYSLSDMSLLLLLSTV